MRVAQDVDRPDLGEVALVDLEHHVDAVLVELDDLGIDPRGESALSAIKFEDAVDIGANRAAREDLPRRELDLRRDLVVLEALVALEDDAVDDGVLADVDDEVARLGAADRDVGEQLGRVQVLQRLIERGGRIGLARARGWRRRGSFPARAAGCPCTVIERIVRTAGAGVAPGSARRCRRRRRRRRCRRGVVDRCGGGAGGTCASSGAEVPPRIVPTMSNAPVRRLLVFDLEITRPRLVCEKVLRRASPRSPGYCPAPSVLANQALKPVP